jgi:hypothetical protein
MIPGADFFRMPVKMPPLLISATMNEFIFEARPSVGNFLDFALFS